MKTKDKTYAVPAENSYTNLPEKQDDPKNRTKFSSWTALNNGFSKHEQLKWELVEEGDLFFYWQLYENPDEKTRESKPYDKLRVGIEKRNTGWATAGFGPHMFLGEILSVEKPEADSTKLIVSECTLIGYAIPSCRE